MPEVGIRVVGGRQLRATLNRAAGDVTSLTEVHRKVAGIAGARARSTAPRKSGRLAGSTRWAGTKTKATLRAGFASVPYAGPIHWGWPRRRIAAQPWVTAAAQATEPTWVAVFEQELDRIIKRIEGK